MEIKQKDSIEDVNERDASKSDDEDENLENPFPIYYLVFLLISSILCVSDMCSDVMLAYCYYVEMEIKYFGLTLTFTIIPNFIMSYFSLKWYLADKKFSKVKVSRLRWIIRSILLFLQLGPVLRYLDTIHYGMKCRRATDQNLKKWYFKRIKYEEADAGLLCLLEAFMEAAPQLLLQLYILKHHSTDEDSITVISRQVSCALSFLSICWAPISLQRVIRRSQENTNMLTMTTSIVQYMWIVFVTASRILALGLFVTLFPYILTSLCSFRWMVWLMWLKSKTTTVFENEFDTALYKCALSVVLLFVFVNPSNERSRWRYVVYYMYTLTEDTAMIVVWYIWVDPLLWYKQMAIIAVFVFFFIGLVFMVIYYLHMHPTVSLKYLREKYVLDTTEAEYRQVNFCERSALHSPLTNRYRNIDENNIAVEQVIRYLQSVSQIETEV